MKARIDYETVARFENEKKDSRQRLLEYYEQASLDYKDWSPSYNMHFGYYRWGINPFNLEAMLNSMNQLVLDELKLSNYKNNNVLDMGCGLGATIRYALGRYPINRITGITLVPWQKEQAMKMMENNDYASKANIEIGDFQATGYEHDSFDGIYAIESASHADGSNKIKLLQEAYRLLKPGKKLVIADAYFKTNDRLNPVYDYCYRRMCENWAVDEFGNINDVKSALDRVGFKQISIKEISWNVAPSVIFVPYVAGKYFISKLVPDLFRDRIKWNHFMASIYSMVVGANRKQFGYYLITAKK